MTVDLLAAPPKTNDRRLNALLVAAVVTALGLGIFAVVAVPRILANASTTQALADSDRIGGCRASFRVDVDDASARLAVAKARLDEATNRGLEAVLRGDDAAALELADSLPGLRENVETSALRVEEVTDSYSAAVSLSRSDRDAFLELCASRP